MLVDITIDQGGCSEDSHPTTQDEPAFRVHDSVSRCIANMPGAVPRTSTCALGLTAHGGRVSCRCSPG